MSKKGRIIDIQGLEYQEPPMPPKKKIRFSERPKKNQMWERHTEYEEWDWNTDPKLGDVWYKNPADGQLEWYEDEIERINFGEWVMINGEPTYFNKYCYFFHQWHTLQEGIYPSYRDTSLEFFRFLESVDNDPFTLGICGIKGRRLGMSSMAASVQLLICLLEENNLHGIVSKTGVDAKELYYMIKFSLENLPPFLMPSMRNIGEKELFFNTPAQRVSKNNTSTTMTKSKGLNNRAGWLPTAENSYDGRRLRTVILDEAAKVEEADISVLFSKISETLVTGASVVGKVLMFSTVNAMDKGGANFKSIWDDSDHVEGKDDLGQTPSRLKRFFIPGYKGVMGYVDQYGNSVVDTPTPEQSEFLATVIDPTTGKPACPNPNIGAKAYREMRRKALSKDPEKLAEEIRKFPFEWREVFKSASNQCYFNVEDINNQLEKVKDKLIEQGKDPDKDELGRRGWFVKLDNGRVRFVDDPKGMWYVHELLPENESNKWEIKFGKQYPSNTVYGAAGLDPFAHAKKAGEGGSDASVTIWKRYSSIDPDNSGMPVAFFIGRPPTKSKFHEQVANALIYYGVRCLGERAPTDWCDWFEENKLDNYLIETKRKTDGEKIYGLAPQDKQGREEHLTLMVESSYSDHDKIWFRRILEDRLHFDIDNRTDYDGAISSGLALMALREPTKEIKKANTGIRFLRRGRVLKKGI